MVMLGFNYQTGVGRTKVMCKVTLIPKPKAEEEKIVIKDVEEKIVNEETYLEYSDTRAFSIDIGFSHPNIDIPFNFGLPISNRWIKGQPFGYSPLAKKRFVKSHEAVFLNRRDFFTAADEILSILLPHRQDIITFTSNGGAANLFIHLAGQFNVGDVIPSSLIESSTLMGIKIGLEVFPM
jgi:hypothetical protein